MAQYAIASELAFGFIKAAQEYLREHDAEETRREYIRAHRNVLVTALNNERDLLLDYFDKRFAERRVALAEFFELMHKAVDNKNTDELQTALAGILGILKDNPLGELAEFRKNWKDPSYSIDL